MFQLEAEIKIMLVIHYNEDKNPTFLFICPKAKKTIKINSLHEKGQRFSRDAAHLLSYTTADLSQL